MLYGQVVLGCLWLDLPGQGEKNESIQCESLSKRLSSEENLAD